MSAQFDSASFVRQLITSPQVRPSAEAAAQPETTKRRRYRRSRSSGSRPGGDGDESDATTFTVTPSPLPSYGFERLYGQPAAADALRNLVLQPLVAASLYSSAAAHALPTTVLLHGPPGSGKTTLAKAIAGEAQIRYGVALALFYVTAPQLVGGVAGGTEKNIRALFAAAAEAAPALVVLDDLDVLCPRSSSREMERRVIAQLGASLDELVGSQIWVVGVTGKEDCVDPALRSRNRFMEEVALPMTDEQGRREILESFLGKLPTDSVSVNVDHLARGTPGFVGADLLALVDGAMRLAITEAVQHNGGLAAFGRKPREASSAMEEAQAAIDEKEPPQWRITQKHLEQAMQLVTPVCKKEGFAMKPETRWEDVGGMLNVLSEIKRHVVRPMTFPSLYAACGFTVPAGVLLYGPPGCGKTLVAKAIAGESGAAFIAVSGPELLNKYVGESESAIRRVFSRARLCAPCIVFFDELDALCSHRGGGDGNSVNERVVNQLLTEMDGVISRKGVFVVAATNRPEMLDPAMLRTGRLSLKLYVGLPTRDQRMDILRALSRKMTPVREGVNGLSFTKIADVTDGYSGADLAGVLQEACYFALSTLIDAATSSSAASTSMSAAISDNLAATVSITPAHIEMALRTLKASVSPEQAATYAEIAQRFEQTSLDFTK